MDADLIGESASTVRDCREARGHIHVSNLNRGQDTRANRTRHTTSSSTQSHAKQQHTKATRHTSRSHAHTHPSRHTPSATPTRERTRQGNQGLRDLHRPLRQRLRPLPPLLLHLPLPPHLVKLEAGAPPFPSSRVCPGDPSVFPWFPFMDFNSRRIVGSFVLPTSLCTCSPSSLFPDKPRMQPAEPRRDLPRRVGVSLLFLPLLPQVALNGFTLALTSVVTPRTMGAALPNNAALANGLLLGFSTLMNALSPFFGSVLDSRRNASLGIYAGAAVQTGGACCLLASDRLLSAGQSGLAIALFAIGIGAVRIGTVATTASVYALVSSYGSRYPGALGMLAACLGTANAIGGSVSFLCTALVTDDKTLYFVVVGSFTTGWLWALLFIPRRFLVLRRNSSPHATASLARARTAPRNSSCYATARTTDPTNDDDAPTPSEPAALSGAELPKGGSMADWPLIDAMDGPPGGAQEAEIESGRRSLDLVGAQQAEKAEENDDDDEGGDDDEEEEAEDAASRPSYGASPHRPLSAGISPTAPVGASSCCGHAALRRALTEWSGERYADWRRACLALLLFNMVVGVVIANGLFFVQDCTNVSADEAVSLYSYSIHTLFILVRVVQHASAHHGAIPFPHR